eukprot:SAG31_NODE_420_length_15868_cov_11.896823_3_plen_70_part_00
MHLCYIYKYNNYDIDKYTAVYTYENKFTNINIVFHIIFDTFTVTNNLSLLCAWYKCRTDTVRTGALNVS